MKTLRNPWFLVFCILWMMLFLAHKIKYPIPAILNDYLADLLAVPVIAQLSLWFQRLIYKQENYRLKSGHIIFIVVYISVVFELILPYFFYRYTADWRDVLCYIVGGIFFMKVMNR